MRAALAAFAFLLLLPLVGCSVENGGKLFQPTPSGVVDLRLVGGDGTVLASSKQHPVLIKGESFSLWVNEQWYSDYFSATVVSWTGSGIACWQAPLNPDNTVLTFKSLQSSCGKGVEAIRVYDTFGHQSVQYFKQR